MKTKQSWGALRVFLVAGAVTVMTALAPGGRAFGQTFEKFDESARDQLPASPFVAAAYAFIWVAVLVYVFVLARGLRRAQGEIDSLKRRIEDRAGAERAAR